MTNSISAANISRMLNYYYLIYFSPADLVSDLANTNMEMEVRLARAAGLDIDSFNDLAASEVARRIVAFQQATRKPNEEDVSELSKKLRGADSSQEQTAAFQTAMDIMAAHPARAKPANRLHRQKGCDYCISPCRYAYFTLMSEPDFKTLQAMLDAENQKPVENRNAVHVLWSYTREHLWKVFGRKKGYISPQHLGNLSYCLLLLSTAKSRMALPEKQLMLFQAANQVIIQNLGSTPINLALE